MRYFNRLIALIYILTFSACAFVSNNKNQEIPRETSYISQGDLMGKVFYFAPELDSNNCVVFGECDCCEDDLFFLNESDFVNISYCVSGKAVLKGKYTIELDRVVLMYDSIKFSDEIDENNENIKVDSFSNEVKILTEVVHAFNDTLQLINCNNKQIFNNVSNESYGIISSTTTIEQKVIELINEGFWEKMNLRPFRYFFSSDSVLFGDDQVIINTLTRDEKNKIKITTDDRKTITVNEYFKALIENVNDYSIHNAAQFFDFDGDGQDELLLYYFSGGIAGSNYEIFKNVGNNTFSPIFSHGGSAIDIKKNRLIIFEDEFRYFFTCGACELSLPNDIPPSVELEFKNGKFNWPKLDTSLNAKIFENLKWLKNKGPVKLNTVSNFDEGERKAYVHLLFTFHFINGRNLDMTKKLFEDYYNNQDKNQIWSEFLEVLERKQKSLEYWIK